TVTGVQTCALPIWIQRGAAEVEELIDLLVLVVESAPLGGDQVVELVAVLHRAARAEQVRILELLAEIALEVRAPLRDLHLRPETRLLPLTAERLRHFLVTLITPGRGFEDDVEPIGKAGLRQQPARAREIGPIPLHRWVVAEDVRRVRAFEAAAVA